MHFPPKEHPICPVVPSTHAAQGILHNGWVDSFCHMECKSLLSRFSVLPQQRSTFNSVGELQTSTRSITGELGPGLLLDDRKSARRIGPAGFPSRGEKVANA